MGGHHSNSPVLTRGTWLLLALLSAEACGQEALIGESEDDANTSGGRGGGELDWGEDCYTRMELQALPESEPGFPVSPATWVGSGRGRWSSATGDTLEVNIEAPATRVAFSCYDDPAAQPKVSFMLAGRVSFRTADGTWDETFDASFGLSEGRNGANVYMELSAKGELDLTTLQGSFMLPPDLERPPAQFVQLSLDYQDEGWTLRRTVDVDRTKPSAICMCPGDVAPAWSPPQLRFVRAGAATPAI